MQTIRRYETMVQVMRWWNAGTHGCVGNNTGMSAEGRVIGGREEGVAYGENETRQNKKK